MSYDQMFHEATSFMPLAQATSEAEGTYVGEYLSQGND